MFTKILNSEKLSKTTKDYYQKKYDSVEKWCFAYKKLLSCLKIGTTSRIEGLNGIIKSQINASSRLVELFYRLLEVGSHALNLPFPDLSPLNAALIQSQADNALIKCIQPLISNFAFEQTVSNLLKAFSHQVKLYKGTYTVKISEEYEIKVEKEYITCPCKYFVTMGIPCSHLLSILIKYPSTSIEGLFRARWFKNNESANYGDSDLIMFCKDFLLNEGKL